MDKETKPDSEIKDLKAAFSMMDKNKDGMVNAAELKSMLTMLGIMATDSQVQDLIQQTSKSGNGLFSQEEFLKFMNKHSKNSEDIMDDILAAFRVFDKDSNGYISRDELKQGMEMIGENVSELALDEMLSVADIDKDGKINYEEFARVMLL